MSKTSSQVSIPASGVASTFLAEKESVRVVNTNGGQVIDTWALNHSDPSEFLSMEHSRSALYRLWFQPGDALVTNRFNPVLRIESDTSPGMHDTLHAACSRGSYQFYGEGSSHANCQDNYLSELRKLDISTRNIPCPWNLFEHAFVDEKMALSDGPASAKPGDYIELTALMPLILICTACPSTIGNISGRKPTGAMLEILPQG